MSENNDIQEISAETAASVLPKSYKLLFGLALAGLIAALLALFQNWHNENQNHGRQLRLSIKVNELQKQLQQSQSKTQALLTAQSQLTDELAEYKNSLTAIAKPKESSQDWLLLKARYYLELAQMNAEWGPHQKISILLLEKADAVLKDLSLGNLLPVRQAISLEIVQLKTLKTIDTAKLLSQLNALRTLVLTLPVKKNLLQPQFEESSPKNDTASSTWRNHLQNSWRFLKKLVIIKRLDNNLPLELTPLQQGLFRESIRLNLQEAQWAVLQNNAAIYQEVLEQALNDMQRIFDTTAFSTQTAVEQLQALQQEKPEMPALVLTQSLTLLNQVIEDNNTKMLKASAAGDDS